jgi:hypothetical protein
MLAWSSPIDEVPPAVVSPTAFAGSQMANRLVTAHSPYLRAAAEQPIEWFEWGPEPFERAATLGRPILLDIGAAWCHWCHVMDHESYEDAAVGDLLNREFVCVKVDRDERPDVDTRYQRAVAAISGQGGWPLTAFLTPTGDVFFGGTYFPPEGKFGRPGFLSVLRRVREVYGTESDRVKAQGEELRRLVASELDEGRPGLADGDLVARAVRRMVAFADRANGGFGRAPKFPHAAGLEFLLGASWTGGAPDALAVVEASLDRMALGGIRDQIGGGWHRYSTDERWIVPHFEKMSADNAELLRLYADATACLGRPLYREAAADTLRWIRTVLALPDGGYGASQDADVGPDDDGGYFTWSAAELDRALTALEAKVAIVRFGLGTDGRMPHDPARNVLFVAEPIAVVAERVGLAVDDAVEEVTRVVAKLGAARDLRPAPAVDRTRYAAGNAMLASAVLKAAAVLDDRAAAAEALAALRLLRSGASRAGVVEHGGGRGAGLLEDQVWTAAAALDAFEATGDPDWLDWARAVMDHAIATCWDDEHGGFFDRAGGATTGLLGAKSKPIQDGPSPSANGVAGVVLARLFALTDEDRWGDRQRRLLAAFAGRAEELGLFAAAYFLALDWAVSPVTHVVVTGPADDPLADRLHRTALAAYLPRGIVMRVSGDTVGRLAVPPALAAGLLDHAAPRAIVCTGTVCFPPATEPSGLAALLARSAGAPEPTPR